MLGSRARAIIRRAGRGSLGTAGAPALVATRRADRDPTWAGCCEKGTAGSYVVRGPAVAGTTALSTLDNRCSVAVACSPSWRRVCASGREAFGRDSQAAAAARGRIEAPLRRLATPNVIAPAAMTVRMTGCRVVRSQRVRSCVAPPTMVPPPMASAWKLRNGRNVSAPRKRSPPRTTMTDPVRHMGLHYLFSASATACARGVHRTVESTTLDNQWSVTAKPARPSRTFYVVAIVDFALLVTTLILSVDNSALAIVTGVPAVLGAFGLAPNANEGPAWLCAADIHAHGVARWVSPSRPPSGEPLDSVRGIKLR
jgi:hypothetical protein